jgi:hypothetical protein
VRENVVFWDGSVFGELSHEKQRNVVVGYYQAALNHVASAVCGDGASVSLQFFFQKIQIEETTKDRFVKLSATLAATKKGSLERRAARAMLCGAYTYQELEEASATYYALKMSRTTYIQSRNDYRVLEEEGSHTVGPNAL